MREVTIEHVRGSLWGWTHLNVCVDYEDRREYRFDGRAEVTVPPQGSYIRVSQPAASRTDVTIILLASLPEDDAPFDCASVVGVTLLERQTNASTRFYASAGSLKLKREANALVLCRCLNGKAEELHRCEISTLLAMRLETARAEAI